MLNTRLPIVKSILIVALATVGMLLAACGDVQGDADVSVDAEVDAETTPQATVTEEQATSQPATTPTQEMSADATATPAEGSGSDTATATPAATEESEGASTDVTLEELNQNTDVYVGQTVTVEGQVNTMVASQIFTLASDAETDTRQVLVVAQDGFDAGLSENSTVTATGNVVAVDEANMEELLNMDIQSDLLTQVDAQVAILAQSVESTG